jgi:hypothetical protein
MENKLKEELFQPLEFWSDIVKVMDGRIKQIATTYGFGAVNLKILIKHGKVQVVTFSEEVSVRQDKQNAQN